MQSIIADKHKSKMAAKAARNADQAARAVHLAELNTPVIHRRRLASIKALTMSIAAQIGQPPAECTWLAVGELTERERNIKIRAAAKALRRARIYEENREREVARRARQIASGKLQVTGHAA